MTPAQLAYITWPEAGRILLNVKLEAETEPRQYELSRDQLFALNAQTAEVLLHRKDK